MNIIIPQDPNVPYVVVDMLSLVENFEVEDIVTHEETKILKNNNMSDFYDKYVFVVPKIELIPDELRAKNLLPTYSNLHLILNKYKNNITKLPYFKNLIEVANSLDLEKSNNDEGVYLLKSRAKNLQKCKLKAIVPIKNFNRSFTFIKPLWNHSYQLFCAYISQIPNEIKQMEFEGHPKFMSTNQKVLDIKYLGACPDRLLTKILTRSQLEDVILLNILQNKSINEICDMLRIYKTDNKETHTNENERKCKVEKKQKIQEGPELER